jgi:hypothetical protein
MDFRTALDARVLELRFLPLTLLGLPLSRLLLHRLLTNHADAGPCIAYLGGRSGSACGCRQFRAAPSLGTTTPEPLTAESLERHLDHHGIYVAGHYAVTHTDNADLGVWPKDFTDDTPAIALFHDDYEAAADWLNARVTPAGPPPAPAAEPRERHAVWCDYWIPIPPGGIAYPCSCHGFVTPATPSVPSDIRGLVDAAPSELDDLCAMTPLANMVRRSTFTILREFGGREGYPADRVAGIIAVAVCMNGKLIDAMRTTIADEDAARAARTPAPSTETSDRAVSEQEQG